MLAACGGRDKTIECGKPIAGLPLRAGNIVWFGEMHGTEESPRFVGDVACQASQVARVQLGLEVPHEEQSRFDRYLASGGSTADREALLAGPFWAQADGRSSKAMVTLVERVRVLRNAGAKIDLVAYDDPVPSRDLAMAEMVIKRRDSHAIFVALSGNLHSRKKGTFTVAHLVERKLPVTTYNVSASGGEFWACMATPDHEPVCGVHPNSDDGGKGAPWTLGPPRDDAHDGVYFVGKTTASPPAK